MNINSWIGVLFIFLIYLFILFILVNKKMLGLVFLYGSFMS